MTDTEIAWCAGFFDGEGCVTAFWHKTRSRTTVAVTLYNTHLPSMERFTETMGFGHIYARKEGGYAWSVSDRQAEQALRLLLPFLFTKREQAELALAIRDLRQVAPFKAMPESDKDRMKELTVELRAAKSTGKLLEA